ncbi:MAG: GNAT family N-acetyltransferase [Balneola sp.]|jgi:predicted GNAT family acetyltransferase|nr:GNAT family N-acetyltransferase [Balneola sp.]MBE79335.1 GNAT family N-acetyltransferase [Balneola sp.]|tara:strand:+ start:1165 stop:1443 length:279 start_codon:yes stop_codon:yes gene_type:complete
MDIKHDTTETKGTFYIEMEGKRVAEMTYSKAGAERIIIDHTDVADETRGQGLGKKLVYEAVEFARKNNLKILPLCPFARSVFSKNSEIRDVT